MFTRKRSDEPELQKTINELLADMRNADGASDDFKAMTKRLKELYALKESDSKRRVSPDTLAIVAGNLGCVAMIVLYESKNVMTSKALSFVTKLR